jgi:putative peptide zinc metalloprotease protein
VEATGKVAISFWQRLRERIDFANYVPSRIDQVEEAHFDSKALGRYTIIKSERSKKYLKLTDRDYFIWEMIDGQRPVRTIILEYYKQFKSFAFNRVFTLLQELRENGFLEERPSRVFSLIARIFRERRLIAKMNRLAKAFLSREFAIRGVDRFFGALYDGFFRIFFTRAAKLFLCFVCVIGFALFVRLLLLGNYSIMETAGSYWLGLAILFGINILVIFVHESAHAFAVKSYGREVTRAGFMIYYGMPAFFVDTSDIWLEGKRRRIAVSWAGPFSELILGSLVSIFITLSPYATLNAILFKASFIFFIGAFVNLNPLLNLDGYYMLMDWLEMPLLRRRSLAFVRKGLWHKLAHRETLTRNEKIYAVFGALAGSYSLFAIAAVLYFWQSRIYSALAVIYNEKGLGGKIVVLVLAVGFFGPLAYFAFFAALRLMRKAFRWLAAKRALENDYVVVVLVLILAAAGAYLMTLHRYVHGLVACALAPVASMYLCAKGFRLFKGAPVRHAIPALAGMVLCLVFFSSLVFSGTEGIAGIRAENASFLLSILFGVLLLGYLVLNLYRSPGQSIGSLLASLIAAVVVTWLLASTNGGPIGAGPFWLGVLLFAVLLLGCYHLLSRPAFIISASQVVLFGGAICAYLAVASGGGLSVLPRQLSGVRAVGGYGAILLLSGLVLFSIALRRGGPRAFAESSEPARGDKEALNRAFQTITRTLTRGVAFVRGRSFVRAVGKTIARENRKKNVTAFIADGALHIGGIEEMSILRMAETIRENLRLFLKESQQFVGDHLTRRSFNEALSRLNWQEREVSQEHILRGLAGRIETVAQAESAYRDLSEILRQNPVFAEASEAELKRIVQRAESESASDGQYIIREGAAGDKFYIIKSGTVEVTKSEEAGVEKHLAFLTEGDYFGEVALLEDVPRTANCIARGPAQLISLSRENFDVVVRGHFELAGKIDRAAAKSALIRKVPLFSDFSPSQLRRILLKLRTREFGKGAYIIRQGEVGDTFYVIEEGEVQVLAADERGRERAVARLGRGEYFGEIALLAEVPRTASVAALSDSTILALSKDDFEGLIKKEMMASESLEKVSSRRMLELKKRTGVVGE